MPIPIIIAILIALFTLGAVKQQKGHPDTVVIVAGKQYNRVDKKDNRNTMEVKAPKQKDRTITIKGQRQSAPFENIFQLSGLYQIIKSEPVTPVNNSINSQMKQAICLSVK